MAKKSGKTKGQRRTSSTRRPSAGKRAVAARRKTAGARTPKGKAKRSKPKRSKPANRPTARKLKRTAKAKAAPARKVKAASRKSSPAKRRPGVKRAAATKAPAARKVVMRGGTGREETLAQTPETGRTRRGPTNPMPTKRSTGTPAGAGTSRSPRLDRERKKLREIDETVPSPPSSLDLDSQGPSAARSGRKHLQDAKEDHTETSPVLTGGDVDADWEDAYSVGDEAPGGDNPTPDQDRVDDIGKALGVTYDDNEELKAADKIADRDKHRWELDPASSEDYPDRD
jgi:Family of unknown function (DUF6335)